MSLPAKHVFERILTQVSSSPRLPVDLACFSAEMLVEPRWNPGLTIARCASAADLGISSNLHFWAVGLEAFMAERGRGSHFVETAICGLCRPIAREQWQSSLDSILSMVRNPPVVSLDSDAFAVYQMLDDGNRRSLLIEYRNRYAAIYWENDTAPRASYPLLKALHRKATEVFGQSASEGWVAAQHHLRLFDPADVVYGWEVADDGAVEPIDRSAMSEDVQLRFSLSKETEQVEFAWGTAGREVCRASYWVRGEEAAIHLMNDEEVEHEDNGSSAGADPGV